MAATRTATTRAGAPGTLDAADETRWTLALVDATTGQVIMTASKQIRHADGSPAGVAAMDVLLTEVLRIEALSSLWTTAMRSFLVAPGSMPRRRGHRPADRRPEGLPDPGVLLGAAHQKRSGLPRDDPERMAQLIERTAPPAGPAVLEMPYQGVASHLGVCAHPLESSLLSSSCPRSVIDLLPRTHRSAIVRDIHRTKRLLITAAAAAWRDSAGRLAALAGLARLHAAHGTNWWTPPAA
ncbi:MAG: PDC sensor domain-containing protein [Desulfobacterales bacterium]|nr:PDC sensor domain-containing protein [Desulfobacterales bacterium]